MKVGLTGGIGCGKSTVVQFFAADGWSALQVDEIVRELLNKDKAVQAALMERYGKAIFRSDGTVNRKLLAKQVFGNEPDLAWLEALLHPMVRNIWKTKLAEDAESNWLVEIPLLFEKKLENEFDCVVCLSCPPKIVENRMARRGYTKSELKRRRVHQMSLEEKVRRSNYVISNAGNIDFLKRQTQRLISQL